MCGCTPLPAVYFYVVAAGRGYQRVGFLNQTPVEVVRSLVLNKHDGSVVSVSCLTTDTAARLHCTSIPATARCVVRRAAAASAKLGLRGVGGAVQCSAVQEGTGLMRHAVELLIVQSQVLVEIHCVCHAGV